MANYYVSSVGYAAVTQWAASTARSLGAYIRQLTTPAVNSERVFKCTTAGTSGATEPTWALTAGATTTDGTAVWTECTGMEAEQLAANWRAPAARINAFPSGRNVGSVSGNWVFLSSDHAETQSTAFSAFGGLSYNASKPVSLISVSRAAGSSLPPVSADITPGASISTTGSNAITFGSGMLYIQGLTLSGYRLNFGPSTRLDLRDVKLYPTDTSGTGPVISLDATGGGGNIATHDWHNVQIFFANVNQYIGSSGGSPALYWHDTPTPLISGSAIPSALFSMVGSGGPMRIRGVDLSAFTATLVNNNARRFEAYFANCKLTTGFQINNPSTTAGAQYDLSFSDNFPICFDNCDDASNNRTYRMARIYGAGTVITNATISRSGGATDGTTPISWQMKHTLQADAGVAHRLRSPGILRRLSTGLGSSHTATIEVAYVGTTALTAAQLWLELEYLGDSGSPLSSFVRNVVADVLDTTTASAQPTSTAAWTATARQNSHAYAVGDTIAVSSNPGRVFYCTVAGTSGASEPSGFASAVDGGSVTDGATFRCLLRQNLTVTFTPQREGFVTGIVRFGAGTSTVLFVDPHLTIV